MSFVSSFEIIKVFYQDRVFSFEFMHQLLKQLLKFLIELKYFSPKEQQLALMDLPANLLNNDPKNPPN